MIYINVWTVSHVIKIEASEICQSVEMTSAVSSLKGKKRTPLPPVRRVPNEVRSGSSLANFDMDEARDPSALDFSTRSAVVNELRRCRGVGGGSLPSLRRTPRPPGSNNFQQKSE